MSGDIADNVFTGSKGGDGKFYCSAKCELICVTFYANGWL